MELKESFKFKLSPSLQKLCDPWFYLATKVSNGYMVTWANQGELHSEHFGYFEAKYALESKDWEVIQ